MKEQAIRKINKMGKAGLIVTRIFWILCVIGLIGSIIGTAFFLWLPKDFFSVNVNGDAVLEVDLSRMDVEMTDEIRESLISWIADDDKIAIQGTEFSTSDAELTENGIRLHTGGIGKIFDAHDVWLGIMAAVLVLICSLITFLFAGSLCKAFRDCASPFEENVIIKMRNLAIALTPWIVVNTLADSMVAYAFKPSIGGERITIGLDLSMVMVVLIVFALVYVFKYGAMLQQESDETL